MPKRVKNNNADIFRAINFFGYPLKAAHPLALSLSKGL
jgi:hypothetical protein